MAANPQANSQYETNKLPGFNKEPFDGKPVHFFDMLWFIPFIVACGNIQQDGWTLHQTYYGNDLGGINNPGGNAAQQAQHRLRVHRLYNVLMHHLKPNTRLYRTLNQPEWVSEGILACDYVRAKGNKPLSDEAQRELEAQWNDLNVESLKLDIYDDTLNDLMEAIELLASKLQKTYLQIYNKFLQACPSQMSAIVASERMAPNANFVFPQNVGPGHPLFVNNPAGNPIPPHPFGGQKDPDAILSSFNVAWEGMIKSGAVRERIKGKAVNLVGKKWVNPKKVATGKPKRAVDEKTCCYKCGGLGHVAKMRMDNGTVVECATTVPIPKDILFGIKYPHIGSAEERRDAFRRKRDGKKVDAVEEEPEQEEPEPEPVVEDDSESSDEEAQYALQLNE